jgi:UDP-N-acetylglucosamine 2-epimerase (non-hydrolysing)
VHPRTRQAIEACRLGDDDVRLLEPLGYIEFLSLLEGAAGVLTDSGGIQEETTYLDVPCFTLRDNTERPITCTVGTNTLIGLAPQRIAEIPSLLAERNRQTCVPAGWDGAAAVRIVDVLDSELIEPSGALGAAGMRA